MDNDLKGEVAFLMTGAGVTLRVACPRFFLLLLKGTLTGWLFDITRLSDFDLRISYDASGYTVKSIVLDSVKRHEDMIDALNEAFLNLSYITALKLGDWRLIHSASYCQNNKNHLIVGLKNSGKSTDVAIKATEKHKVFSDDLTLYNPITAEFVALGLPLRVRRPLSSVLKEVINPSDFVAGKGLAYSKSGRFDIAPAGETFLIDDLLFKSAHNRIDQMPLLSTVKTLQRFIISEEFVTQKTQSV